MRSLSNKLFFLFLVFFLSFLNYCQIESQRICGNNLIKAFKHQTIISLMVKSFVSFSHLLFFQEEFEKKEEVFFSGVCTCDYFCVFSFFMPLVWFIYFDVFIELTSTNNSMIVLFSSLFTDFTVSSCATH